MITSHAKSIDVGVFPVTRTLVGAPGGSIKNKDCHVELSSKYFS